MDRDRTEGGKGEELAPGFRQGLADAPQRAEPLPQKDEVLFPGKGLQLLHRAPGPLDELALVVPVRQDLPGLGRDRRRMEVRQALQKLPGRRLFPPGPAPDRPYPLQEKQAARDAVALDPEQDRSDLAAERRNQVPIDVRLTGRRPLQGFDHESGRPRPILHVEEPGGDFGHGRRFQPAAQRADIQPQPPGLTPTPGYECGQPICAHPRHLHDAPTVPGIVCTFDTAAVGRGESPQLKASSVV
ncbi:MAG TPA: hypothetical protein VJ725_02760 [Thermoanaerobaculia bacterium]|nr:hypothetical protein [Thermoanaerobaculia bacterium]